jgi:hypothetical protein
MWRQVEHTRATADLSPETAALAVLEVRVIQNSTSTRCLMTTCSLRSTRRRLLRRRSTSLPTIRARPATHGLSPSDPHLCVSLRGSCPNPTMFSSTRLTRMLHRSNSAPSGHLKSSVRSFGSAKRDKLLAEPDRLSCRVHGPRLMGTVLSIRCSLASRRNIRHQYASRPRGPPLTVGG